MDRVSPEGQLLGSLALTWECRRGLGGALSTYFGCYGGRGHPGSWYLLSTGAHSASTSRAWLSVSEELHTILPPLQGGN